MTKTYPVCDLHCDTILALRERRDQNQDASLAKNDLCIDIQKLRKGGVALQTFALFTDRGNGRQPEHEALRLLNEFQKQMYIHRAFLLPIFTRKDLDALQNSSKTGVLLSLEEGDVMFQDLDLLEFWQRMGVRLIALTWNYPNAIGHPNISFADLADVDYRKPAPLFRVETEKGLTEHGKQFVHKCEELGILIDVSHLGDKAFWDVMEMASKPVLASHSNCRALCEVSRNLSDEQIRAIAKTGGVIGLNFCADFLRENDEDLSRLEDMIRHLEHLRAAGGIDVCAIGTDFDGIHSKVEIEDASQMQKLADALEKAGWSEEDIAKVMGENVFRVLQQVLPEDL